MLRRNFLAVLGGLPFLGWLAKQPRECVWKEGVVGDWDDPRNWEGGSVPSSGDDIVIRSGKVDFCTCRGRRFGKATPTDDGGFLSFTSEESYNQLRTCAVFPDDV